MRKFLALLLVALCASPLYAASQKDQIAAVIKENPQLVFDVLRADKAQFLEILEAAITDRETQEKKNRFESNLNNPMTPEINTKRPYLGALDAPITIVEYSDFLCKYCGQGSATIHELLSRYPGQIRVFFKHYPARPGSIEPAAIFEALGQKNKETAWKFADLAFANQAAIADGSGKGVSALLQSLKVDYKQTKKLSESKEVLSAIEADVKEAKQFGIDGTPTFLINGIMVKGAMPIQEFDQLIQKLLQR